MNYQQTIEYLYNTLPMFSRMGSAAYKKDLHNTIALCEALGNPHLQFKSIHVGGTNGKGSVSHMLAAILQSQGYVTGLYTSPHLYDFRERIRINGQLAEEQFVTGFVEKIKPLIEELQPSFFETTVAMAFEYFASKKVDVAVIEVGMGGRLDSTNIIQPELSIITNIGWDHMNILGNSLGEIAREKAGIIKKNTPVVIGERQDGLDTVFLEAAKSCGVENQIFFASDEYQVSRFEMYDDHLGVEVCSTNDGRQKKWKCSLQGIYQLKNICTVLKAVDVLNRQTSFQLNEAAIARGLLEVRELTGLHGRWEIIHRKPMVVLEVAHNTSGIREMLQHLETISYQQLHLVLGMARDKDVNDILQIMPSQAKYYFTQAHLPRALDASELKQLAHAHQLEGEIFTDVNGALNSALASAGPDDLVIVCGSIFLVAEVNRPSVTELA